jgi:hypothetical protein
MLIKFIVCQWLKYPFSQAKQALATLADVASQYDTNGVDIHFLNYSGSITGVTVSCISLRQNFG